MKKKITIAVLFLLIANSLYANKSYFKDLTKYLNKKITVLTFRGNKPMYRSGKLIKIYEDGILLKAGDMDIFLSKFYITEIRYENKDEPEMGYN